MKDEALKLALEVLEDMPGFRADIDNAITAIKQALVAPVQEPVAWMFPDDLKRFETSETYAGAYSIKMNNPTQGQTVPLYTTPPAAQRQPLTEERIWELAANCLDSVAGRLQFARAIEAAHGITGEKK